MIILEDADIDRSVEAAIWGGLSNAGQTCISVERIFVHETIYSEIVKKAIRRNTEKKIPEEGCTYWSHICGCEYGKNTNNRLMMQKTSYRSN